MLDETPLASTVTVALRACVYVCVSACPAVKHQKLRDAPRRAQHEKIMRWPNWTNVGTSSSTSAALTPLLLRSQRFCPDCSHFICGDEFRLRVVALFFWALRSGVTSPSLLASGDAVNAIFKRPAFGSGVGKKWFTDEWELTVECYRIQILILQFFYLMNSKWLNS